MAELVGAEIVARYRIHDHRADDGDHVVVGEVDGTPVLLDRRYVEADVRILTGFVEPHFFAGFSGGPKGVCPGLAATATILEAHSPARIADPRATWLVTEGNPVHDFVRAATALCPPDLSVDVAINSRRRLTGGLRRAAARRPPGRLRLRRPDGVTSRWTGRFDVVLTTNGGYPLDRNLYQAVKGMAAAERVVADGGIIVMAAACADGVPGRRRLRPAPGRRARARATWLRPGGPAELDRWQAQVLGRVLGRAEVWLHTDGLLGRRRCVGPDLTPVRDLGRGGGRGAGPPPVRGPAAACCPRAR